MKNRATIRMSAGVHTVTVNVDGKPQVFDLNKAPFNTKDGFRQFVVQFVRSFRDAEVVAGRLKAA